MNNPRNLLNIKIILPVVAFLDLPSFADVEGKYHP